MFGPGKAAAQLEGSKTFAKRVMDAAGVPTGGATRAGTLEDAVAAIDEYGAPYVVKADGLAAGKGVLVTPDRDAAIAHANFWLAQGPVLVEEFLTGQEVSLFLLSDGHSVLPLSPAQDYKRIFDGDEGPNTGGMGAYSPLPWLPEGFVDEVIDTIAVPTVRQLASEHTPFIGLLYCGLILTKHGIRVIEFNARFGDPETQVVLPRLVTPLSGLLLAAATGELGSVPRPQFSDDVAVTVVLASEGYPEEPMTGRVISGLDQVRDVTIAHAATALVDGRYRRHRRPRFERRRNRLGLRGCASQGLRGARHDQVGGRPVPHRHRTAGRRVSLEGWRHTYSGKVRDLYESPDRPGIVLMVASDRVSAFDHVLDPGIPGKGELLTRLSRWWFDQLDVPNHVIDAAGTARGRGTSDDREEAEHVPDRVRGEGLPRGQRLGRVPPVAVGLRRGAARWTR